MAAGWRMPVATFRCWRALWWEPNWGWVLTLKVGFLKGTAAPLLAAELIIMQILANKLCLACCWEAAFPG